MGNEVSTVFGAASVVGTSVVAGVTLGQVEVLNNAVKETSKFTADKFMKTNVRHVGELTGTAVAAAVTLGQFEGVNNHLKRSAKETGKTLLETGNNTANGVPVVGHIKGGIHRFAGDTAGADAAFTAVQIARPVWLAALSAVFWLAAQQVQSRAGSQAVRRWTGLRLESTPPLQESSAPPARWRHGRPS